MRGRAEHERKADVDVAVVGGVAELVQHRARPPLVRNVVAQHPHVALPIDVDAERVLALPLAGVQVALLHHRAHVEPEALIGTQGERLQVGGREVLVEIEAGDPWRLLEERVVVVPRAQVADGAAEAGGPLRIETALPLGERRRGGRVDLVEGGEQPFLVEVVEGQRHGVVVAVAE